MNTWPKLVCALCLAGVLWALASGCGRSREDESAPEPLPAAISEAEEERGQAACEAYVERVCACAQAKPDNRDIEQACQLAPAKRSSLNLVLRANRSSDNLEDRVKTGITAQRIMGSCISEQGKLDSLGCPRPSSVP